MAASWGPDRCPDHRSEDLEPTLVLPQVYWVPAQCVHQYSKLLSRLVASFWESDFMPGLWAKEPLWT